MRWKKKSKSSKCYGIYQTKTVETNCVSFKNNLSVKKSKQNILINQFVLSRLRFIKNQEVH